METPCWYCRRTNRMGSHQPWDGGTTSAGLVTLTPYVEQLTPMRVDLLWSQRGSSTAQTQSSNHFPASNETVKILWSSSCTPPS